MADIDPQRQVRAGRHVPVPDVVHQPVGRADAVLARLRETEARLEEARESHFAQSDGLHNVQGALFNVNAEVARLEAEIRHRRESQHEYQSRVAQLRDDQVHWQAQIEKFEADHARWSDLLTLADERVEQGEQLLEARRERLPVAEEAHGEAQEDINRQRHGLAQIDQRLQVEIANRGHAQRSLQIAAGRRERLQQERDALPVPDTAEYEIKQETLAELRKKCDLLEAWAATQGAEAHCFLIDPARYTLGDREAQLTSDDCGTTQHYLLLDEFYRTAIWLGGRTPLWWLVPVYEEANYRAYTHALLSKRFVRADEVLDLGHLARIPPGEFIGAGMWQLFKGIHSPFKSVLKLLLTEVYASEHPRVECLSLRFKQAVYEGRLDLDELDPYVMVYRRIERYLLQRGQSARLELVRRSWASLPPPPWAA